MVLVDDRVGSRHYADLIGSMAMVTRLEYGDVAWNGVGIAAGGGPSVGVEIKKVLDAVACMYSGRLADHQIPGLRASYDVCYLLIEGLYRPEPGSGVLQYYKGELGKWGHWQDVSTGKRRLMYSAFASWLTTMELQGMVRVHSTPCETVTAAWLVSQWHWWQRVDHSSFHTFHTTVGGGAELHRPGFTRRVAAQLPGVGWEKSKAIVDRLGNVANMVGATVEEWESIDGIGPKLAEAARDALFGRKG